MKKLILSAIATTIVAYTLTGCVSTSVSPAEQAAFDAKMNSMTFDQQMAYMHMINETLAAC
jgi:hypothetical protein